MHYIEHCFSCGHDGQETICELTPAIIQQSLVKSVRNVRPKCTRQHDHPLGCGGPAAPRLVTQDTGTLLDCYPTCQGAARPCPGCQACWCRPEQPPPGWWRTHPSPPAAGSGCSRARRCPLQILRGPWPSRWHQSHLYKHHSHFSVRELRQHSSVSLRQTKPVF